MCHDEDCFCHGLDGLDGFVCSALPAARAITQATPEEPRVQVVRPEARAPRRAVGRAGRTAGPGTGTGGASTVSVFSSSIAVPSKDCRTEQTAKSCISLAGTWNGAQIDISCTLPRDPNFSFASSWTTACSTGTMSPSVTIPYDATGTYDYSLTPNSSRSAALQINEGDPKKPAATDRDDDVTSANFISAEIAGTVTKDATTHLDTLRGTFTATWGPPKTGSDGTVPATLNGTFSSEQYMHPCKADGECASGRRCVNGVCG